MPVIVEIEARCQRRHLPAGRDYRRIILSRNAEGEVMDEIERAERVLYRYVMAKVRILKRAFSGTAFVGLRRRIEDGESMFMFLGGVILIDLKAPNVVTADDNDNKFFEAIIGEKDDAIEVEDLRGWREYVLNGGPMPLRRPLPEC
jgi:hypothetical protein